MNADKMKSWKIEHLDSKSPSFCGAKWYNASMWFNQGTTTSCHHNPPHKINVEAIKTNPRALHNTPIKKQERAMMQRGEKPVNCQFCWVMEEVEPDGLADRTWMSWGGQITPDQLNTAFNNSYEDDYDLTYLEIGFDRTCNLACSYCAPSISTSWSRDIKQKGPYLNLPTDHRNHYISTNDEMIKFGPNDENPYADAFFKWWDESLHKTMKQIRITGGEPMMSGNTWKLLDWLAENSGKADCRIEMTTNLAYDHDTLMRFLDKCSQISVPIWVYSSGETIKNKIEYIRDGLEWDLWQKNLDTILTSGVIANTGLCATLSAPAADGFVEFLHWLLDMKKRYSKSTNRTNHLMLSVNPLRFPTFQSIVVLPLEIRRGHKQGILDFISLSEFKKYFLPIEIDHISRFANYLDTVESPHNEIHIQHNTSTFDQQHRQQMNITELQRDFKSFFTQYDQRRSKNFTKTFPNLADWYNSIS